jgi:hypothetical protein
MEAFCGAHNIISFSTALTYEHAGYRDQPTVLQATQVPKAVFNFLNIQDTNLKV